MELMERPAWTDERLDDLNRKVSELDRRMEQGFAEMREELRAARGEISAQNRMMLQLFGGMFAMTLIGFLGVIATVITQT
jgi:hypothetical protein